MIIKNDFATLCWFTEIEAYEREATQLVNEALRIDPYFHPALRLKYFNLDSHDPGEGIKLFQRAREIYPNQPQMLLSLFELNWKIGNKQKALEYVVELLDKHKDTINRSLIAEIYFEMGKLEDGLRWLEKSAEIREPTLLRFANDGPRFKFLQKEPRFRKIFKKINHPLYADE